MLENGFPRVALASLALLACSRPLVSPTTEAAAPSASAAAAPAPLPSPNLSLFYASDGRGRIEPDVAGEHLGGLARWATLIDRARLEAKGVAAGDAGDFLPAGASGPAEET